MPSYPDPKELTRGMTVEIEQGHGKEPIKGEVEVQLEEAGPTGATAKLKSGAKGRVSDIVPKSADREQPR
jgi:hypothetical protein